MAKADIEITIQAESADWGGPQFTPGDTLRGVATIFPDEEIACKQRHPAVVVEVSKLDGRPTAKANDLHGEVEW